MNERNTLRLRGHTNKMFFNLNSKLILIKNAMFHSKLLYLHLIAFLKNELNSTSF